MSWINKTVALFVGLALVACSKQEPQALQTESSTHSESAYTGPKETVSLALNASLDGSEARALDGSVFHRGRLRPNISGGKVKVWLYLGSQGIPQGTPQFSEEVLEFDYNKETNSVHYRGEIQVPKGLLEASDLKMLLVVANGAKISNGVLTMRNVKTQVFEDKTFADDETLPIDVPYFSKWMDVHGFVTTSYNEKKKKMEPFLDVARTDVLLRPQGHVIKMELSSSVTALDNLNIRALQIESNAITDGGTYALPTSVAPHIGVQPVFTPDLTTQNVPATHKFRKIVLPVDKAVDNSKTRTIFLWVAQIPGQTEQTWTRTFARVEIPNPVLDKGFTINDNNKPEAWWNGASTEEHKKKLFPIYYTKSDFARTGSTMAMHLNNLSVTTPITRLAYSYASQSAKGNGFSDRTTVGGPNLPLGLAPTWPARFYTDYSHYTFDWLAQNNYLGDNPTPIVFDANSAGDPNSRGVEFYIPTVEEFRAILPTDPNLSAIFQFSSKNKAPAQTVTERVKLGNRKMTTPKNYESTYQFLQGEVFAVRFKGGDNRHKTIYRYRNSNMGRNGVASVQLQAIYLGEFYPEINTPEDVVNYANNYPGATPFHGGGEVIVPEERILPLNQNNWSSTFRGNLYWVNNVSGNTATYFVYEYLNGSIAERTTTLGEQRPQENVVILMRDFK